MMDQIFGFYNLRKQDGLEKKTYGTKWTLLVPLCVMMDWKTRPKEGGWNTK